MTATRTLVVAAGPPARVDAFVRAALPGTSRRLVRALIDAGAVRVNGRPTAKGAHVVAGDTVDVPLVPALEPEPALPLVVLHEDARVVAVDKPGGVPAHALDPRERGTVGAALLARFPELAGIGDPLAPGLVHRLDTGTSGVLVAARTPAAFGELRTLFRTHAVRKRYVAFVTGAPEAGTVIDVALAHDPRDRRRMVATRPGLRAWPARSTIRTVAATGGVARIEVEIRTGVTHQVRVHLALAGHPILGDLLYGGPPVPSLAAGRHALHAAELAIDAWGLAIVAPLAKDLTAL